MVVDIVRKLSISRMPKYNKFQVQNRKHQSGVESVNVQKKERVRRTQSLHRDCRRQLDEVWYSRSQMGSNFVA